MNIECSLINKTLKINMLGELDEYSSGYARTILDDILNKYSYDYVVFDLGRLDFMDSTGIGVLIGRYKNLIRKNKKTYISNPNKTIEKIFNMSGLFEIMPKIS